MAEYNNTVIFKGFVGMEPKLFSKGERKSARFRLGVPNRRRNSTTWFDVWVNNNAEQFARELAKGHKVFVRGSLHVREFNKRDGSKGTSLDVWADDVEILQKFNREQTDTPTEAPEPSIDTSDDKPPTPPAIDDDDMPF